VEGVLKALMRVKEKLYSDSRRPGLFGVRTPVKVRFSSTSRMALGATHLLCNGYRVFTGVKRLGRGVDRPPTSSAEVNERVELYLYYPMAYCKRNFTFTFAEK
jgi:hypothetical protein